jgi:hypothetical protein
MRSEFVYSAVMLALGVLLVLRCRRAAEIAIRQRRALGGRDWPTRSFEIPFLLVGLGWIAWALFMAIGTIVFRE